MASGQISWTCPCPLTLCVCRPKQAAVHNIKLCEITCLHIRHHCIQQRLTSHSVSWLYFVVVQNLDHFPVANDFVTNGDRPRKKGRNSVVI